MAMAMWEVAAFLINMLDGGGAVTADSHMPVVVGHSALGGGAGRRGPRGGSGM